MPSTSNKIALLDQAPRTQLGRGMTAVATFLLTMMVGAGAWLFAPSSSGLVPPPPNLEQYDYVDGVLAQVDLPVLVMNAYAPIEGESRLTFRVRDANINYFDVVHLRAHSSIGLPTRVYFERIDNELIAVYKIDAPVNSSGGSE